VAREPRAVGKRINGKRFRFGPSESISPRTSGSLRQLHINPLGKAPDFRQKIAQLS